MRIKSGCLVCRGAGTKLGAPCLGCKGYGWVFVESIPTPRPEANFDVQEIVVKPKVKKLPSIAYKPLRSVRRSKSPGLSDKIIAAVTEWQRAYLDTHNIMDLRPMVLRDIAAVVGCDAVTVHLHLRDQQICGVDARWLFSESVSGFSNKTIMFVLKEIMQIPATDAGYVKMLADRGITIARRTVTKYRLKIIRG